jgi:hypothetical protein
LRYTNGALIPNGSAIEIYEGGSKSVTFDLKIDNPQSLSVRGNLYVMSKKSSSASSSLQYLNVDFTNNNLSSWYSKEFTISLNATNFSATGGRLYGQFNVTSSSGGVITGNIIPIKVIPSPPGTIPPEMIFIGGPGGTISTTINEGDTASVISGTGAGNYTYQWYKSINGYVSPIPGATNYYYYYPGTPIVTTKYFRQNTGSVISRSNEITITVINNATPISNNTITIDGMTVNGSIPTGGIGTYQYSWYVIDQDGDTSTLPDTSQNLILTPATFNRYFNSPNNFILRRGVSSGSQGSGSNDLLLPHSSGLSLKTLNNEDTLISAAYPNPTSGSVNFTTSFSSNKEMEIIVYSEKSGKAQRIFKGTTTPNQIVKWDIPSNYPKGTYYYKIVSDNKEVKTGKILYQ